MPPTEMLGPIDVLYPYVEFVLLGLVLLNAATRAFAHRRYVAQNRDGGADAIDRFAPHVAANALLLLGAFYYTTIAVEPGILLSLMVIGVVISDVFEFEARLVEARRELPLDTPKGSIAAWTLAAIYVAYRSLFFVVEPIWGSVVV